MLSARKTIPFLVFLATAFAEPVGALPIAGDPSMCCPALTGVAEWTGADIAKVSHPAPDTLKESRPRNLSSSERDPEEIATGPLSLTPIESLREVLASSFPTSFSAMQLAAAMLGTSSDDFRFVLPHSPNWDEPSHDEGRGADFYSSKFTGDMSALGFLLNDGRSPSATDDDSFTSMTVFLVVSGLAALGWWRHSTAQRARSKARRPRRRSSRRRKSLNPGFFSNTRS